MSSFLSVMCFINTDIKVIWCFLYVMLVKLIEFIFKEMHVINSGGRNCNCFTVQTTINTHIYDVCICDDSFERMSYTDCDTLCQSTCLFCLTFSMKMEPAVFARAWE